MKTIYLTVKIVVEDDVNVEDFVSEVDYEFKAAGIVSTEIVDSKQK